jgi:hypothetical protein
MIRVTLLSIRGAGLSSGVSLPASQVTRIAGRVTQLAIRMTRLAIRVTWIPIPVTWLASRVTNLQSCLTPVDPTSPRPSTFQIFYEREVLESQKGSIHAK